MLGPIIRTLSFFEQWSAEVLRQPALMFTLVVAPFLVLLAFGEGVELGGPRPRTVIVQDADAEQPVDALLVEIEDHVEITGVTESLPLARVALERGDVDAVVVVPSELTAHIERGERIPLEVLIGEIDPVRRSYARAYLRDQVAELNQRTLAEAIGDAQGVLDDLLAQTDEAHRYIELIRGARGDVDEVRAQVSELRSTLGPLSRTVDQFSEAASGAAAILPGLSAAADDVARLSGAVADLQTSVERIDDRLRAGGGDLLPTEREIEELERNLDEVERVGRDIAGIPAEVLSEPFRLDLEDVTPTEPSFTAFYAPGVLALLVQHLAFTLAALTMSRMRVLRVVDVLKVAPIRTAEIVGGVYVSYGALCAFAAAALAVLMVVLLDVPVAGPPALVALTIALLIVVSLGAGLVASLISSSVQQATQIAMLLLIGSIFFSGFAFTLDQIAWPSRAVSYIFPARYAIRTLQDVMLRGVLRHPEDLIILGAAAVVLLLLTVAMLRRELRAA